MTENEIAGIVVDTSIYIHKKLGPGLLESVYEAVLTRLLESKGLIIDRQVRVPIKFDDLYFEEGFRADIIVDKKVILELKSIEKVHPVHKKQLLTYLKLTNIKLGLLLNFGEDLMKNGIERIINGALE
jgi:GxxExxY protein